MPGNSSMQKSIGTTPNTGNKTFNNGSGFIAPVGTNLFIALGIFVLLLVFNRLKIRNLIPYLFGGVAMWYFMLNSGVHATITGVLLAFTIPFGNGNEKSSSYILQHFLHKPVAFIILPVFALANTAIILSGGIGQILT